MSLPYRIYRNTIAGVPFGILLMVSIATYIAVGSGWVGLRERLEMDELLFFNWWPLKLLIVLLVTNLTIVTVTRIPLTPPRYGVWSIHLGIILLCMSLSAYYSLKTEGMVPLIKGRSADYYYDRWERALYVRTQFGTSQGIALPGLPRFHEYDESLGNGQALDRAPLRNLDPQVRALDEASEGFRLAQLGTALGLKDPIKLDIIGYYPYAIAERYRVDPTVKNTGLRVRAGAATSKDGTWLVASQAADAIVPLGPAVLEHRHVPTKADVDLTTNAAKRLHKLTIKIGDRAPQETFVEPGETIEADGYTVRVEGFTPQFELSDASGKADMLTVHVDRVATVPSTRPAEFRRTILSKKNVQTDFELNAEGAGPFGKRKRDGLLDDGIQLSYTFNDPTKLLPTLEQSTVKYLLITADDTPGITLLRVSSREASVVNKGENAVDLKVVAPAPMLGMGGEQELAMLNIERVDHVAPSTGVVVTPREQRNKDTARGGEGQMVRVRVRCGDFTGEFPVPYDSFAADNVWASAKIKIPGATGEFQMMLSNQRLPMPLTVRLEKFEPIPYAGGDLSGRGVMRDFRSTITLTDRESGQSTSHVASLNSPAFFKLQSKVPLVPGQSWLLSQATWNPGNLDTTVLQLGNRPAVGMMITACCLIFGGLLYAFYAKPLIIRRMKANAIKRAQERAAEKSGTRIDTKDTNPHESGELISSS